MPTSKAAAAARRLLEAHEARQRFEPLPPELAPASAEEAYAIQDAFVALRSDRLGAITGYKVALASAAMRRFVGVEEPQLGAKVHLQHGAKGRGKLVINYNSLDELDGILAHIQ